MPQRHTKKFLEHLTQNKGELLTGGNTYGTGDMEVIHLSSKMTAT